MKEKFSKIISFAEIAIFMFSGIGSPCYLFYDNKPQFAIASMLLTYMAVPELINAWKRLSK